MPSFSLEGFEVADSSPSLSIFSPRSTSSFTNVALVRDARENESQLHPRRHLSNRVTHFMCFTALEPTLSATNSTVLRSEGGWLWKKACSRSTCHHTAESARRLRAGPRRRRLTCSFCWDLLGVDASLGSAEVGVIFRMMPPLLAVLPDTNAARSFRNSPAFVRKRRLTLNIGEHPQAQSWVKV